MWNEGEGGNVRMVGVRGESEDGGSITIRNGNQQ